jgi:NAD-dependent deacetylase
MPEVPRIVVLTGAGVSQESGLATFRDLGGIWSRVRLEEVATPEAFAADPARVHAFYNARRAQLADPAVQPNAAHRALARLDAAWPGDFLLVTQNVDNLHERAGSERMVQMHGALNRVRCSACAAVTPWQAPLDRRTPCPGCGRTALRPDIVWFGEMPMQMERIAEALDGCTLFVSIGTSGQVHPAAGFVAEVRDHAHTVELNLEPSAGSMVFDEVVRGPATKSVPAFVDRLLAAL